MGFKQINLSEKTLKSSSKICSQAVTTFLLLNNILLDMKLKNSTNLGKKYQEIVLYKEKDIRKVSYTHR